MGPWWLQLRLTSPTRRGGLPWLQLRSSSSSPVRQLQAAAAAGSINASEGLFALDDMPDVNGDFFLQALLGRPLALVELFFVLIWVNWKEVAISSAAAITFSCLGTAAAGFGRCGSAAAAALQYIFTSEDRHSVLVDLEHFNESYGEVGHNTASSLTEGIGDQASGRVDVPGGVSQPAPALHERLGHSGDKG